MTHNRMPDGKDASFKMLRCLSAGIHAVEADTRHVFARHSHDQFGIGLIERGAQKSLSGRGVVEAGPGDIITVNPGEVHDGAPLGDRGRAWRMLYLDPNTLLRLVGDEFPRARAPAIEFIRPAIRDPRAAARFQAAFAAVTRGHETLGGLEAEERLIMLLGGLLLAPTPEGRQSSTGLAAARARIDDDPRAPLSLQTLALDAGLSRFQFVRAFSRETGLTPHAYIVQRRLQLVRRLIGRSVALAEAATASGFADQSHMTRCFVRSYGVSPGVYARSLR